LSPETLVDVLDRMDAAMSRGLNSVDDHDIRMFPTYINSVPNSKEKGEFLCMDLGITRLVISLVELRGKRITFKRDSSRAPSSTLIETKSPSLPPNMQWLSNGNDKSKEPIAYQCLLVDFPDEFRTYSADNFFQYLVERLKDFLSFSKRVPQYFYGI